MFDNCMTADPEHHLKLLGDRGANCLKVYELYDRDSDHVDLRELYSVDFLGCFPGFSCEPLLYIWGEVEHADRLLDFHLGEAVVYRTYSKAGVNAELISLVHSTFRIPMVSFMMGMTEKGNAFFVDTYGSLAKMEAALDTFSDAMKTVITEKNPKGTFLFFFIFTVLALYIAIHGRCSQQMLATNAGVYIFLYRVSWCALRVVAAAPLPLRSSFSFLDLFLL